MYFSANLIFLLFVLTTLLFFLLHQGISIQDLFTSSPQFIGFSPFLPSHLTSLFLSILNFILSISFTSYCFFPAISPQIIALLTYFSLLVNSTLIHSEINYYYHLFSSNMEQSIFLLSLPPNPLPCGFCSQIRLIYESHSIFYDSPISHFSCGQVVC